MLLLFHKIEINTIVNKIKSDLPNLVGKQIMICQINTQKGN